MKSIRGLFQIVVLALFFILLNSCSKDEELVYENTDVNKYQIAVKEVESLQEGELQVIKDEYSKFLTADFGLFTREGLAKDCDKDVVLACKDAECRLSDVSFKENLYE